MKRWGVGICKRDTFTFQSGSIQMRQVYKSIWRFRSALHSNLVLFKYYGRGSADPDLVTLHSNLVLFKSLAKNLDNYDKMTLHSNLVLFKCYRSKLKYRHVCLYIPIWFYSNQCGDFVDDKMMCPLHSNLVLFKCISWIACHICINALHSNLVLFK